MIIVIVFIPYGLSNKEGSLKLFSFLEVGWDSYLEGWTQLELYSIENEIRIHQIKNPFEDKDEVKLVNEVQDNLALDFVFLEHLKFDPEYQLRG